MKRKLIKAVLYSVVAIILLLGCDFGGLKPWEDEPIIRDGRSYTVSFDRNGGSGTAPASQTAQSGEDIILPNAGNLSRTNFTFVGWNSRPDGSGRITYSADDPFTMPNQNVTLYAKWDAVNEPGTPSTPSTPNTPSTPGTPTVTSVTVSPATVSVARGQTQQFSATVNGTGSPAQTVTWTVSGGGSGTSINSSGLLTIASSETATTLTVRATSTVDTSRSGTATVTVSVPSSFNVNNLDSWNNAIDVIQSGGNNKTYTITVTGDFSVPGNTTNTFGPVTGLTVTLEGGRTISLSSRGELLTVGNGQTVTLRNLNLKGHSFNYREVVSVRGTFIMHSGNISGNAGSASGGGVRVLPNGTFTMQGGTISGNRADFVGGGVLVDTGGSFTKTGGTIYGNDATSDLINTAGSLGHAIYSGGYPNFQYRDSTAGPSMNTSTAGFWEN